MSAKTKIELRGTDAQPTGIIQNRLPDNNAGEISAADVRDTFVDIVDSIVTIVANDMDTTTPFLNDIKIKRDTVNNLGGVLYCSGIQFDDNTFLDSATFDLSQTSHSQLANRLNDDHPQYLLASGQRMLAGDLGTSGNWINSSGALYHNVDPGYRGIRFQYVANQQEIMHVGSGTYLNFLKDDSTMHSAKGVAKAWINFTSSNGNLSVNDSYNISRIQRTGTGKFTITFTDGILKNNHYIAIASSNGQGSIDGPESFREIEVGTSQRVGEGTSDSPRSVSFWVYDKYNNNYVDAALNELVVFGSNPGAKVANPAVTVINISTTTTTTTSIP